MTRYRRAAPAVLLLPLLLGGCVEWTHPYKSSDQFARDNALCQQQAIEKVQASHQQQQAAKWMAKATGSKTFTVDANDSLRNQQLMSCLQIEGWSLRPTGSARRQVAYNNDQYSPQYSSAQAAQYGSANRNTVRRR